MTKSAFLLDSNLCIYILRDENDPAARRLASCETGAVVTSAIVFAEVMRGIAPDDERTRRAAEHMFAAIPVLPFDEAAATCYIEIPFKRGTFDRLIAAHALALGLILVTNNERDFAGIAGLRTENWTAR